MSPDLYKFQIYECSKLSYGRQLTDDIADNLVEILTQGKMKDDSVYPHTDYLAEFPYLGKPYDV